MSDTARRSPDGVFSPWLPGLPVERIVAAYAAAPGRELDSKLQSPESSAALVGNAFGFFLERAPTLPAFPRAGNWGWPPHSVRLEATIRFPWSGGRHPCLDVLIETPSALIGVESKRYEPFRASHATSLSAAYWRPIWGEVMRSYEALRDGLREGNTGFSRIDAGQLVKHAFALRTQARRGGTPAKQAILLYLYAEPLRWPDGRPIALEAIERHRAEIDRFARAVAGDEVLFQACAFSELLAGWAAEEDAEIRAHAAALARRFSVESEVPCTTSAI